MPGSRRWKTLQQEIVTLREQFLPDPFDPVGVYAQPDRVQAHTRAFVVLSHAEIESYLESWAKEIAKASELIWNKSQRISRPLAFLFASIATPVGVPATLTNRKDGVQRVTDSAVKVFQDFYTRIKDNHGVKEMNVLSMFSPIGVPASALGATLLPNLETLGAIRGTHAHQSKAVISVPDPETEWKRLETILADLEPFDAWLVGYKKQIR